MPSKIPFCVHRSDRTGYWFDRRVPIDCQQAIGKKHWRCFAGHTAVEARKQVSVLLQQTEQLIEQARAGRPIVKKALTHEEERRFIQGNPEYVHELVSNHAWIPDDVEDLIALPRIESPISILAVDIIDLSTRIKRPSKQTVSAWVSRLEELSHITKVTQLNMLTKQDAQKYRDTLLDKGLKVSTVKVRCNYISGLLSLAVEEGLLSSNVFEGITKRLRVDRQQVREINIAEADSKAQGLPTLQRLAYSLLRYTGCRLAEVLGIYLEDLDLTENALIIRPHPDRPLKTQQSARRVPIHRSLLPVIEELKAYGDRPFARFYKGDRWGGGMTWGRTIGCHPHGLRHNFISELRKNGVPELIIGRLVGHVVPGQTAAYGKVPWESLVSAVDGLCSKESVST